MKYIFLSYYLICYSFFSLTSCGTFSSTFENVIDNGVFRPLGISVEQSDISPGKTIKAQLHLFNSNRSYEIQWQLQVFIPGINNNAPIFDYPLDLLTINRDNNLNTIEFLIPDFGNFHPFLRVNNALKFFEIEQQFFNLKQASTSEIEALKQIGIVNDSNFNRTITILDSIPVLPSEISNWINQNLIQFQLTAIVSEVDFNLEITKNIVIRYSEKIDKTSKTNNTNESAEISTISLIVVSKPDIKDPNDLKNLNDSLIDTIFFSRNKFNSNNNIETQIDTISVDPEQKSYFLLANSPSPQDYIDTTGAIKQEVFHYFWFVTHVNPPGVDWDNYIRFEAPNFDVPNSKGFKEIVSVQIPSKNTNIREFKFHLYLQDSRNNTYNEVPGASFLDVAGYLKYP